ncbi:MAG: pdhA [Chlamydiia bacterium]|nr:pdhA [Chlamydiia bacterium]
MTEHKPYAPHFFETNLDDAIKTLGKEGLLRCLKNMLLIRNFEIRAESAYQHGKVGGFFHSYIGQEAIQTSAIELLGPNNWFSTTYRCHAMALLLGVPPKEIMAELYGRVTGNAKGRGGSMHLYSDRMLGGFGIVGGQIPVATGAAFRSKYMNTPDELSICFMGDGAVAQGAFHESLNIASLWNLPCVYVIENNTWGMGTHVAHAVANYQQFSKKIADAYGMRSYMLDGMDFFNCYSGFKDAFEHVRKTSRPVLIECITQRFKGHSISDPALYRSKDDLKACMQRDPISILKDALIERKLLTEEEFKEFDKEKKEVALDAMKYADESPWPDPITLEEEVFAP